MSFRIFSFFLFSSLFLVSCHSEQPVMKKRVVVHHVGSGDVLLSSDTILGVVEGQMNTKLSFKAPGRIHEIRVQVGDRVKKGQVLAILGNEEGLISAAGMNAIIQNTGESGVYGALSTLYSERISNMDNEYLKVKINQDLAGKDLALAKKTLENSLSIFKNSALTASGKVRQAQTNLSYAQNNLENTKKLLDSEEQTIRKNALSSMSNAFIIARNARDFSDEILGISDGNRFKNDAYEPYLSAKKSSEKTEAEALFIQFNAAYEETYAWYYAHVAGKSDISDETLKSALEKSSSVLIREREMLHKLASVLEYSVSSSLFPEEMLNEYKKNTTTLLSSLEGVLLSSNGSGVKGSLNMFDSFQSTKGLKIQQLVDGVSLAEEDVKLATSGKGMNESDIEKNIDMLRSSISMKEDALRLTQVAEKEIEQSKKILLSEQKSKLSEVRSKLSELDMQRDLSNNSIRSGIIEAPFDGIILEQMMDTGSVISPGLPVFGFSSLEGKIVSFSFDPLLSSLEKDMILTTYSQTSQNSYTGRIRLVRNERDLLRNKSYAEMELTDFFEPVGTRVEILLPRKVSSTFTGSIIPSSAIMTRYGEPSVYVLEKGVAHLRLIQLVSSIGTSSMIFGVQSGEVIIVDGKENVLDGESISGE